MGAFVDELKRNPVIAAVRDDMALERACDSEAGVIFLLGGRLLGMSERVRKAKMRGKRILLHMDLCEGLGKDTAAVDFCAAELCPDGIISTKAPLIKHASELGLITVQRIFLMDSQGFINGVHMLKNSDCDLVEVLPGLVPKAISFIGCEAGRPVIAGGMITTSGEINQAFGAGAIAVSTSCMELWNKNGNAN